MLNLKIGDTKSCGCWKARSSSERMSLWHKKRRERGESWPRDDKTGKAISSPAPGDEGRTGHSRALSAADVIAMIRKNKKPA